MRVCAVDPLIDERIRSSRILPLSTTRGPVWNSTSPGSVECVNDPTGKQLVECFDRATPQAPSAAAALRNALSCYYSGNFSTGWRHGYVRKVIAAAAAPSRSGMPSVPTPTTTTTTPTKERS